MPNQPSIQYTPTERAIMRKVDIDPITFRPEALRIIESNWLKLNMERADLFNSVLLRFISLKQEEDQFCFEVAADVYYKDVVGLRHDKGILPRKIDEEDIFQVMSCYILIRTADQKTILTVRDSGDWGRCLDMPGGFIQDRYGFTDIADFAIRRTKSDLRLEDSQIVSAKCIGVCDFRESLEMIAIYTVQLNVTFEELRNSFGHNIFEIPENYTRATHENFFDLRLHHMVEPVMDMYVEKIKPSVSS